MLLYQAIEKPSSLPTFYASLELIRKVTTSLEHEISMLTYSTKSLTEELSNIRQLYALPALPKLILDGGQPFPEVTTDLLSGVSVEFRSVRRIYIYINRQQCRLQECVLSLPKK